MWNLLIYEVCSVFRRKILSFIRGKIVLRRRRSHVNNTVVMKEEKNVLAYRGHDRKNFLFRCYRRLCILLRRFLVEIRFLIPIRRPYKLIYTDNVYNDLLGLLENRQRNDIEGECSCVGSCTYCLEDTLTSPELANF